MGASPATGGAGTGGGVTGGTGGGVITGGTGGGAVGGGPAVNVTVERVATWKYDATAAYSIVHDDICDGDPEGGESWGTYGVFDHWREGSNRGLHMAWGAIGVSCTWPASSATMLADMIAVGDELVNHSWYHCDHTGGMQCETWDEGAGGMVPIPLDLEQEMFTSRDWFEQNVPGAAGNVVFYAFPLDATTTAILQQLQSRGYLGARGGDRNTQGSVNPADINPSADPLVDFHTTFDAYNATQAGISMYPSPELTNYLDDVVSQGGWGLRELHGISDLSWGTVDLGLYTAHLDDVQARVARGEVWMHTPTRVIKYRRSRYHCGTPTAAGNVISFSPDADCQNYATPISVIVTAQAASISASQGGMGLEVVALGGNRFIINIDPAAGDTLVTGS